MHVVLITSDSSLTKELSSALPAGTEIKDIGSFMEGDVAFFDMEGGRPGAIKELSAKGFVIAVSRQKNADLVLEATSYGAYDVLGRPLSPADVKRELSELSMLGEELRDAIPIEGVPPTPTCAIVGKSREILDVCKKLALLAQSEAPVLITGETGTGKELIAESIAQISSRFGKPFIVINSAAVPETLLESELFGFEKGAFTGALAAKEGMLKIADGGCVFLDEVGELPLSLQGKLLRFLQTQSFYPIGSTREVQVDVRVISATNRDLPAMIAEGKFREDLYYRLRVTSIHIPPLRERAEDILPLIKFFIRRYRGSSQREISGITKAFLNKMTGYEWPGNIRELENAIRSAIALNRSGRLTTQDIKHLGEGLPRAQGGSASETLSHAVAAYAKEAMELGEGNLYEKIRGAVDTSLIDYVLGRCRDNQSEAARVLGINRLTLRKKLGG